LARAPVLDLTSFLTIAPQSRRWEAYIQGRRAIYAEFSNLNSAEPQLRLIPIDRWGARITALDRTERFLLEGNYNSKTEKIQGKILVRTSAYESPPPAEAQEAQEEVRPKIDPEAISSEELWQQIFTRLEWIIVALREEKFQIKVWCGWEFRAYYNSLGSAMTSVFPLSKLKISVYLTETLLIKRAGAREGAEFFSEPQQASFKDFLQDVQHAKAAKKRESIPKVLILDPEAMAMFIHEALGHSSEGDHILAKNSYLHALLGRQIAPSNVTIIDSPKDFSSLGSYRFDDEGTSSMTTPIVKDGIVSGYLTDRSTAAKLKMKPTGNSRSFWYDNTPKVRMSNFVMLPGKSNFEDILRDTREGLLVKGMKEGWSNEKTGDFGFKPNIAFRIRDGELKKPVPMLEIEGNAHDYLRAITDITSDWSLCLAGCGKPSPQSDYAWVGYGAPFVKFELQH
jgi:predicted Zn-dependent protease